MHPVPLFLLLVFRQNLLFVNYSLEHLWIVSQKLYKNSSDISDRAVEIASQKAPHDSNFSLIRSWNPKIAFHSIGPSTAGFSNISFLQIWAWWYKQSTPRNGSQYGFWLSFNARSHKITMFVSKKIDFISKSGVTDSKIKFSRLMIEANRLLELSLKMAFNRD